MTTIDLNTIVIRNGSHASRDVGVCLMEAVAWVAGEPHSDEPTCACPVLSAFARRFNDAYWPTDRDRTEALAPLIPLLIGTRNSAREQSRAYALVDIACRKWAPLALDAAGLTEQAAELRALDPAVDAASAKRAAAAAHWAADAAAAAAARWAADAAARWAAARWAAAAAAAVARWAAVAAAVAAAAAADAVAVAAAAAAAADAVVAAAAAARWAGDAVDAADAASLRVLRGVAANFLAFVQSERAMEATP